VHIYTSNLQCDPKTKQKQQQQHVFT